MKNTRHNHKWEYILLFVMYVVVSICNILQFLVAQDIFTQIIFSACGVMFIYFAVKEAICYIKEKDSLAEDNTAKSKIMMVVTAVVSVFAIVILFFASIPWVNDFIADNVRKDIVGIELPEKTELVESLSRAEKLVGNGNGMQYLGAILIESELSVNELKEHYAGYEIDDAVGFIQKVGVSFDANMFESQDYYVIYGWGKGVEPFAFLDIRGY